MHPKYPLCRRDSDLRRQKSMHGFAVGCQSSLCLPNRGWPLFWTGQVPGNFLHTDMREEPLLRSRQLLPSRASAETSWFVFFPRGIDADEQLSTAFHRQLAEQRRARKKVA